jgi:predicted ABC-type ATPase
VPEEKIRARYRRALALLPRLVGICDKILIYDNSSAPALVFSKGPFAHEFFPSRHWPDAALRRLVGA